MLKYRKKRELSVFSAFCEGPPDRLAEALIFTCELINGFEVKYRFFWPGGIFPMYCFSLLWCPFVGTFYLAGGPDKTRSVAGKEKLRNPSGPG